MRPLAVLPRAWPSIDLPGYREHPMKYGTYSGFAFDDLPAIERPLDSELRWLLQEPIVRASLAEVDDAATRPATQEQFELLSTGQPIELSRSFMTFVASDEPRARIRSNTDCYLDLADFVVPVSGGGSLIHFLSDSQWVLHWLLYSGPEGSEAVVVTETPLGFELGDDEADETARMFVPDASDAAVCADSFSEFLYRFWIENEIWFNLADPDGEPPRPLTDEQCRYAEHYR